MEVSTKCFKNRAVPYAYGKVSSNTNHPEYVVFEYLKSVTPEGIIPKIDIPSPIYLTIFCTKDDPYPKDIYGSVEQWAKVKLIGHSRRGQYRAC
jgi:hypothetical protein